MTRQALPATLANNRTLQILSKAEEGGYGVAAMTCYDAVAAVALVRAAERAKSPAIMQLFPVTMHWGGEPFLAFCLNLAHSATVPISVHLDHATTEKDIDTALTFAERGTAFDSIMVDASHADTDEENLQECRRHTARATKAGVAVEVELGRLEGGEAGLRVVSDAQLTNDSKAEMFMSESGATLLAPSIGNLHGKYVNPPNFDLKLLSRLHAIVKKHDHYIALHGTDELPDQLWVDCVQAGARKFNINSWARDPTMARIKEGLDKDEPLPDIYEAATEVYAGVCERFFDLLGSRGKA
ncbi:hypothetical protein NliqN6_5372 [Naganishia liquefaciens]|uniref:Fructose-bisphosphate aldolase n=1 Tax=Naganishia liquefaciens TaxID=104408 RepID=A0A8H3TXD7_9TREE|nr:hypothetical protein NliqN6_5372 [Naganishia liquefaciens]